MTELGHLTVKVKCAAHWRTQSPAAYIVPAPSSAVLLQMRVGTELCHRQPTGPVLVRAGPSWNKNFRTTASFLLSHEPTVPFSRINIRHASDVWRCSESRVQYFTP